MDFKVKVLNGIKDSKDFKNGDVHQSIMNLGYDEWQKEKSNWSYSEMLKWVEENYGKLVKFATLVGKYNQQVGNGGHMQYFDNSYTGGRSNGSDPDIPLHKEMIGLMQTFGLDKTEIGKKVFEIMWDFEPQLDTERYIVEEYYDDEEEDYITDEYENENYGMIENTGDLDRLDDKYYEVNDEWMKFLNDFFNKELETNPSAYNVTKNIEVKKKVKKPSVKLVGTDGNAYALMGKVKQALREAGLQNQVNDFIKEATSGDYNNLIQVCMKYVNVY